MEFCSMGRFYGNGIKGAVKKEASENKCSDLQKRERCICFCDMIKLQ